MFGVVVKRIGFFGGMSWELLVEYEWIINIEVCCCFGGVYLVDLLLCSFDFAVIEVL